MIHVFCHHPSLIHGRDQRCPDCNQEPGSHRPSHPIDDSTLARWAETVMKRWEDAGDVRVPDGQEGMVPKWK